MSIHINSINITKFTKKVDAIKYKNKKQNNRSDNRLFQEDINNLGKKCFYYTNPLTIYRCIKENTESHYYEFWDINDNICFSLDIDISVTEYNNKKLTSINSHIINLINNVIQGSSKKYNYKYNYNDIIVLESNIHNKKYSYHVIFKGLVFENYLGPKDFYSYLSKNYDMFGCDSSIYNLTCLRTCFSSKMGKHEILLPIKLMINNIPTRYPEKDLEDYWLDTLLTYNKTIDKLIPCNNLVKRKTYQTNNFSDTSEFKEREALFKLPSKYYDNYETWIAIGMILYNKSQDNFNLWDEWSKQSSKYDDKIMSTKWKSFSNKTENKLTYGTLYKWFVDEKIIKTKPLDCKVSEYPIKEITISDKYKSENNICKIINKNKLDPSDFINIINYKLIAIQSEKGTGKTKNLLDAMFLNNNIPNIQEKKILFVSSRRTFGIKLLSDLKKYGFELYSEIKDYYINNSKIICQIDSLLRIDLEYFDYIIVDECESLARYMTSVHFIKNNRANLIVNTFEFLISEAKHVYIMDADLSDRCMNYYTNIIKIDSTDQIDMQIIVNDYKYYSDYTIRYMKYALWLDDIIKKINKYKLCIPMASNNKAKDLYTKLTNDFPKKRILLIHKETEDKEKMNILLEVNTIWTNYDVVIYTPSVCMGVSFDIPNYFDYIYAYGCTESLGSQEFCQMIHRVRTPTNKIINLTLDNFKDYESNDNIDYRDVENILCNDYYLTYYDLYNNMIQSKISRDSDNNKVIAYPFKDESIYDLYVRNAKEIIEDRLNFASNLFGYFKYKTYKLDFYDDNVNNNIIKEMKNIRNNREEKENEETINGIMKASILNKEEYIEKIKLRPEYLTDEDIYSIKKYNFLSCYKIDDTNELTKDLLEEYYDREKMKWYRNITSIIATQDKTTDDKLIILQNNEKYNNMISNCYLDFTSKNKFAYHFYPINIINKLGFNINDLSIVYPELEFKTKLTNTINWCTMHAKDIAYKYNIKLINKDLTSIIDLPNQLKYLNSILKSQYGFKIKKSTSSANIKYQLINNDLWENINLKPIDIKESIISNSKKLQNTDYIADIDMFIV